MIWVLIIAAGFWGLGHIMKAPVSTRVLMLGMLYVAVLLAYLIFPESNGIRRSLGGSLAGWLILGGVVALVWGYQKFLGAMKTRATGSDTAKPGTFQDVELERYARHIVLREIGGPGQKRLKAARVLVIGAGGLGSPVLQYLTAAGVGTIGVIDDDVVDNSNLQRQVIHKDAAIGMPKVFSAEKEMLAQNPHITVRPYNRRLEPDMAGELFADYDLILDGCDNFDTRYLVNRTCVALRIPLISGALSQWEGQVSTFHPASGGPCYACIFPKAPAPGLAPSCAEAGVIGPLPGVVGSMMAVEAIKEITQAGEGLRGRMLIYDALFGENQVVKLKKSPGCAICAVASGKI